MNIHIVIIIVFCLKAKNTQPSTVSEGIYKRLELEPIILFTKCNDCLFIMSGKVLQPSK